MGYFLKIIAIFKIFYCKKKSREIGIFYIILQDNKFVFIRHQIVCKFCRLYCIIFKNKVLCFVQLNINFLHNLSDKRKESHL